MPEARIVESALTDIDVHLVSLSEAGERFQGRARDQGEYWLLSDGELALEGTTARFSAPHVFFFSKGAEFALVALASRTVVTRLRVAQEASHVGA